MSKAKSTPAAVELLAVRDGRPVHLDPLQPWRLQYYPDRGYWRRTRSHRDEVSKENVSPEIGVSIDIVTAWERAMTTHVEEDSLTQTATNLDDPSCPTHHESSN